MNPVVRHLSIRGLVQGVGYRWNMAHEAERLGVTGWVRNRLDGSVEAMVAGEMQAVDALITWARRGPLTAQVTWFEVTPAQGDYAGFEQRPTA